MKNVIDFKKSKRKKILSEGGGMINESISLLRRTIPPVVLCGDDSHPYATKINDVLSGLFLIRAKLKENLKTLNDNEDKPKNV